jgi:hypothetical protein
MAGGLQLAQTTFSIGQPDTNGIFAEKGNGQEGGLRPQIQPQGLRPEMEGTWGSGQPGQADAKWLCGKFQRTHGR